MVKKFFVWKDPSCNGKDIEWLELIGKEFFSMLKQSENRNRKFIRFGNEICADADIIVLEATQQEYIAWRQEQNAKNYLKRQQVRTSTTSLDAAPQETDLDSFHEVIADESVDVERAALVQLAHETLRKALGSLSNTERNLLIEIYIKGRQAAELAREQGVHRSTVTRRVSAVITKLKKFF